MTRCLSSKNSLVFSLSATSARWTSAGICNTKQKLWCAHQICSSTTPGLESTSKHIYCFHSLVYCVVENHRQTKVFTYVKPLAAQHIACPEHSAVKTREICSRKWLRHDVARSKKCGFTNSRKWAVWTVCWQCQLLLLRWQVERCKIKIINLKSCIFLLVPNFPVPFCQPKFVDTCTVQTDSALFLCSVFREYLMQNVARWQL